jgi:Uma2 family endonuclease
MAETVITKRRLTREDYRALREGPPYYELVDGELMEMTKPRRRHYRLSNRLIEVWNPYARGLKGELAYEPNLYLPGIQNVYHPDLVYVDHERIHIVSEDGISGTPSVICEILSPSTERLDRGVKLEDYRRAGVPHVWLFNPEQP